MNKKLLLAMMTLTIGAAALTGCSSKDAANTTNQETTVESEATEATEESAVQETEETTEEAASEQDPTVADEAYYMAMNGLEAGMSMTADEAMLVDSYGIDPALLSSYHVEMGMNRVAVSEIAVFELKDEKDLEAVQAGIAKRQQALDDQWSTYLEDQYELVKNAQTIVQGNMVLYVVSADADQIVANFNAMYE